MTRRRYDGRYAHDHVRDTTPLLYAAWDMALRLCRRAFADSPSSRSASRPSASIANAARALNAAKPVRASARRRIELAKWEAAGFEQARLTR